MLNGEFKKKILFITGKGGVGKSTVTSAIAYHLAKQGKKILVLDADPAHSMPDVFGITEKVYGKRGGFIVNSGLTRVYDGLPLDLLVLNPVNVRSKYNGSHQIMWLAELGKELGFFAHLDRMSEFFTLADTLYKMHRKYDYFVIDNEPSAGTLDMIESIDGWLKALDNVGKYNIVFRVMLTNKLLDRQLADEVRKLLFDNNGQFLEEFLHMLEAVKSLFTDADRFQPIIVSSPEDAVIRETYRLRKELNDRLGIPANSVIFNKVSLSQPLSDWHKERIKHFVTASGAQCYTVPFANEVDLSDEKNAMKFIGSLETLIRAF